ncbi:hypothetical protein ANANG_G00309850 [Anguilla anguilla]|uniref:Uncharacterized protein n=1 Tax=Anguilla anguilla TaxID=7936 RepID=A0A9D3RHW2_ANGAN|nr:hypothetical protein ANANG_G00309850 [Anguilla anguilla]
MRPVDLVSMIRSGPLPLVQVHVQCKIVTGAIFLSVCNWRSRQQADPRAAPGGGRGSRAPLLAPVMADPGSVRDGRRGPDGPAAAAAFPRRRLSLL